MAIQVLSSAADHGTLKSIFLALASYGSFATADAIVKSLSGGLPLSQIAFTMASFALIPVLALTIGRGGIKALVPGRPGLVLLRALMTTICMLSAWNALARLPLADAYAMLFAAPLLVTGLSVVILGETVGWRRWTATLVGFLGVVIMIRPGFATLEIGHGFGAMSALTSAIAFIILRKIGTKEKSAAILGPVILTMMMVTGAMTIPDAVGYQADQFALLALAGLLMGSGQVGVVLATRAVSAALVAPFQYTQMIWAIMFGILLFGDLPDAILLTGLVLVVGSGLYTLWREAVRRKPARLGAARGTATVRLGRLP